MALRAGGLPGVVDLALRDASAEEVSTCSTTASSTCCAPSSRTTSPPTSRWARKALVDRHNLGVSPATIRNDMAALEEQGYIAQPHTSAGRVPTDKGYRLFVDRLSPIKPLSPAGAARDRDVPGRRATTSTTSSTRTVRLLAQLTRQVAVVQYPSLTRSAVRHIELVPLGRSAGAAGAHHRHRPGRAAGGRPAGRLRRRLDRAPARRAQRVPGRPQAADAAGDRGRAWPTASPPTERPNAAAVFSVLLDSLVERHEERVVFGGTANLAARRLRQGLRDVLEALEEQVVLMRLLGEADDPSALTVRIGAENAVRGRAHLGGVRGLRRGRPGAGQARRARPDHGWTTRARWERCARWHGTSARFWRSHSG